LHNIFRYRSGYGLLFSYQNTVRSAGRGADLSRRYIL